MVPLPRALFVSLLVPLTMAACLTSPDDDDDDVSRHRRQWESQEVTNYRVQSRLICFCIREATEPALLEVRNLQLVSVTRVSDGVAVPASEWEFRYFTVDAMFDLIADAQAKGAAEVRVSYDPQLGYPTQVFVDMSIRVADDERQFEISGLTATR